MKTLIVDDDPNTIELIKDTMDWDALGVSEVLYSYNGINAKQVLEREKPEIVLCDIEMPQCNGLEVLRYIYENDIETEFIFLTCHGSFDYAQKAIEYNAIGYLMKPFKPEEVSAVLMKAVIKVNKKVLHNDLVLKEHYWRKNQDIIHNGFLWAIFQKTVPDDRERLRNIICLREIDFDVDANYYLVYAGVSTRGVDTKEYTDADYFYILHHLGLEIINNQFNYKNAVEYALEPYSILLLVVKESESTLNTLKEQCEKLIAVARTYLDADVICLIGNPIHCERMADEKKEMDALFLQKAGYNSKVLLYNELIGASDPSTEGISLEKVLKYLRNREKVALIHYIRDFMESSRKDGTLSFAKMNILHHDLLQIFYGYLQEHDIQADTLLQDKITRQMNEAAQYSVFDMIKYVNCMYDRITELISELLQTSTVVAKAKKYIQEHYMENIDRNDVAGSVFLTPNYLSKLFNSETGLAIREYINQLRIDEAKRSLLTTNKAISSIALDVGFENVSYFSTVFKKYCGCNPDAWRRMKIFS